MKGLKKLLSHSSNVISGIAAAPGIVIGKTYLFNKEIISVSDEKISDPNSAIQDFMQALERSKYELNKIFELAKSKMGEERAEIFQAQMMILDDQILIDEIIQRIKKEERSPEYIVHNSITKYQDLMVVSSETYMQERALDIEDIKHRIIKNLQKKRWQSKIIENAIVVSSNLSPSDTILFSKRNTLGYVLDRGGLTSHAAIIARSLNLPAVVGTHNASQLIKNEDTLIVDGFHGFVFVNPTEEQISFYKEKVENLEQINLQMKDLIDKPTKTIDGIEIELMANVDVSGEIDLVLSQGANGVGLYRTEQVIEELGVIPSEEEQTKIYSNLATRLYPLQTIIRAFDIGGDKIMPIKLRENNPFLGLRGIRFLLDNKDIFSSQIRAILKASVNKNVKFMIPMISTFKEITQTKQLIKTCMKELDKEKIEYDKNIKLGIMIEVPSAAVMANELAKEVDFFSIGTNDLIQYLIAVDRGNDYVSHLYQEFNPSVLKTLGFIIEAAKRNKIEVSICGEMAADTLAVPILIGLGLNSLSVSPAALLPVKRTIRSIKYSEAKILAENCARLTSQEEVLEQIDKFFKQHNIQRTRNLI